MDSQWQAYQDYSVGRPAQFGNGLTSQSQQLSSKYSAQPQHAKPPVGYTYETFQTPSTATKPPSVSSNSRPVSMAASPIATPRNRDYGADTDTTMEDADPYNRAKYPTKSNHQSRPSSQYMPQDEATPSSAARRYSPMNVLSPSAPYNSSPSKSQASYAFPVRQSNSQWSPTRTSTYSSPPQAYQSLPS